jgi:hypothetical protein
MPAETAPDGGTAAASDLSGTGAGQCAAVPVDCVRIGKPLWLLQTAATVLQVRSPFPF